MILSPDGPLQLPLSDRGVADEENGEHCLSSGWERNKSVMNFYQEESRMVGEGAQQGTDTAGGGFSLGFTFLLLKVVLHIK